MPVWRAQDGRDIPITLGPDGLHHAKVSVGVKPNGRPDRRHRSGKTVAEVETKLRALFREIAAGRKPKVGRIPTVEAWFTSWLTDIAPYGKRKLARRSLDDYWSRCRNWIFPHLGAIRVDALEPDDLDRLYAAMYSKEPKPCSEGHVLKVHAVIRRGLEIALRRGHTTRNVARMIDPPGAPTVAQESLSAEASRAVLEVARGRRNGARWYVGIAVGPRQGETLGLRWSDLDLDAGTVSIEWQLQRLGWRHGCDDPHACGAAPRKHNPKGLHHFDPCPRDCRRHAAYKRGCPKPCARGCQEHAASCPDRRDGGLVFTRPKGWRRRPRARVVALPAGLVAMLREHRKMQAAERLEAGSWWKDLDLVFAHSDGRPIDPRGDWQEWKSVLAEAGVDGARVHVMRHSTATDLLIDGVDIAIVQEVLGHADIRTTRGYQDVRVELTRRAADKMQDRMFGVTDLVTEKARRRSS